jgi:ElaA protein
MSDASLSSPPSVAWRWCHFEQLTLRELQFIYMARQQVFAVEQVCAYLDADGYDEQSFHLAAWSPGERMPLAYARLVHPGVKYAEPSIGRVITTAPARGAGLGRELVRRAITHTRQTWPTCGIRISAQAHLAGFYGVVGFVGIGVPYSEDGIPHLEMLLAPAAAG